jgi:hypothetical protein
MTRLARMSFLVFLTRTLSSSPADVEMLEDLVTAAFNEAGRRADEAMKSNLTGMLGGLNLPPGLL